MPRYRCVIPSKNVDKQGDLMAPKSYSNLDKWFNKVVKLVGPKAEGFQYVNEIVTRETIIFELRSRTGDRGSIIIDRKPT